MQIRLKNVVFSFKKKQYVRDNSINEELIDGYYVSSTKKIMPLDNYGISPSIHLNKGESVHMTATGTASSQIAIAVQTSIPNELITSSNVSEHSGQAIGLSNLLLFSSESRVYEYTASEECYVILSYRTIEELYVMRETTNS